VAKPATDIQDAFQHRERVRDNAPETDQESVELNGKLNQSNLTGKGAAIARSGPDWP
jgi:hypothetical protein